MRIEHIKKEDFTTNIWSGGTTTELAIYPKNAEYKKGNFLFRISTATVESEESNFTKLDGVSRKLMILNGKIKIEHKNQHSKTIGKFEQDSFEGNWDTKSYGKATDFNLMTKEDTTGEFEAFALFNKKAFTLKPNFNFYGFYLCKGSAEVIIQNETFEVSNGDMLNIYEESECEINIIPKQSCEVVITKVKTYQ